MKQLLAWALGIALVVAVGLDLHRGIVAGHVALWVIGFVLSFMGHLLYKQAASEGDGGFGTAILVSIFFIISACALVSMMIVAYGQWWRGE